MIDISGKPCHDDEIRANDFRQYILRKQDIQTTEFEQQVSEGSCAHRWTFKFVSPSDVRNKVKAHNFKNSAGPDGISPSFQKRSSMAVDDSEPSFHPSSIEDIKISATSAAKKWRKNFNLIEGKSFVSMQNTFGENLDANLIPYVKSATGW